MDEVELHGILGDPMQDLAEVPTEMIKEDELDDLLNALEGDASDEVIDLDDVEEISDFDDLEVIEVDD